MHFLCLCLRHLLIIFHLYGFRHGKMVLNCRWEMRTANEDKKKHNHNNKNSNDKSSSKDEIFNWNTWYTSKYTHRIYPYIHRIQNYVWVINSLKESEKEEGGRERSIAKQWQSRSIACCRPNCIATNYTHTYILIALHSMVVKCRTERMKKKQQQKTIIIIKPKSYSGECNNKCHRQNISRAIRF